MTRRRLAMRSTLCMAVVAAIAAADPLPERAQSLLRAERDLASAAAARGLQSALAERAAAMAVLFQPRPVGAVEWTKENPPPAGRRTWTPDLVEISGAGDLGSTEGRWRFEPEGGGDARSGSDLSIWRYHPQTDWRLLLHVAVETPPPAEARRLGPDSLRSPDTVLAPRRVLFPHDSLAVVRRALQDADHALGTALATGDPAGVYARIAAPDLRLYVAGLAPARGHDAARAALARRPRGLAFEPASARVAESGDLGYTYGTAQAPARAGADSIAGGNAAWSYVHLWRRDAAGSLRLAVEVLLPVPPRE